MSLWIAHRKARNRKTVFKILVSLSSFLLGGSAVQQSLLVKNAHESSGSPFSHRGLAACYWLRNQGPYACQNRQRLYFYTILSQ